MSAAGRPGHRPPPLSSALPATPPIPAARPAPAPPRPPAQGGPRLQPRRPPPATAAAPEGPEVTPFRSPGGFPLAAPPRTAGPGSNGLTLDRQRRLIACEHGNRRVSRTEPDGTIVALAERWDGRRLNSPNDVVVRSDGTIYFTDPYYGLLPHREDQELPFQGLFRID